MSLHDLVLEHYSDRPVEAPTEPYVQLPSGNMKPVGLWVSVKGDYDWPWWCIGEQFHLENLSHQHRVRLAENANVLLIDTFEKLTEFHEKWAEPLLLSPTIDPDRYSEPDWREVAKEYDGLIIAPYQWEARFSHLWYYGWDCASGCIWHPRAIESLTLEDVHSVDTFKRRVNLDDD